MSKPRPQRVVLIGMMGSGKSTVGRALAVRTGWRYMDNDELVRAVSGRQPEEIDATDGDVTLHAVEARALQHALQMAPPLIVGAAAWVVTDPGSAALLREEQGIVYLRATPRTLHGRIGAGHGRREDATDLTWIRDRFTERDATYRHLATRTIDTDALDAEAVADLVLGALSFDGDESATHARISE